MELLRKKFCLIIIIACVTILYSCSKPIVVNNKIDLSRERFSNAEIENLLQLWKNKIINAEKNNDLPALWQMFSEDFRTNEFYNVYDFFKARWESAFKPLLMNIVKTEIRDIKYSADRPAATLTLLNENINSGKALYLTISRDRENNWKIDGVEDIKPDIEKFSNLLEKNSEKENTLQEVLSNLDTMLINEDYVSAYHLVQIILEKSSGSINVGEKEANRIIGATLKISNFYFYLYAKTKLKKNLLDNIKLLENVFRLSVYDSKIFYTIGYAQILNGNLRSANSYFDRALQIIKPAPENYDYIKNLIAHIIDIHLISNEWNAAAGKLKSLENIFSEHAVILKTINDYQNSWQELLKYNCKDISLKYKALEFYKTLNFDSAVETLDAFRNNYSGSFYSDYTGFMNCLSKYYVYAASAEINREDSLNSLRSECEKTFKNGTKYLPLIYSLYIESFLKEGNHFSDYNNARKIFLKFHQLYDVGKLDKGQMLYVQLAAAKNYHLLKLWEQALAEYKRISEYLKKKTFLNPDEKDILKYVDVIIEKQSNSGYLAYPYLGAQVEQASPLGNIIVKKVIDNPALLYGDVILSVNSIPVNSLVNFYTILNSFRIGSSVKLKVFRKNSTIEITSVIKDYI